MTPEEAIKILYEQMFNECVEICETDDNCPHDCQLIQVKEMAIKALKTLTHTCGNCKHNHCDNTEGFCKCNYTKGVRLKTDYCSWWEAKE